MSATNVGQEQKGQEGGSQNARGTIGTARAQRPTSKDRRHAIRKRAAMRRGQYAAVILGGGLDPAGFVDSDCGLIRVTPGAVILYRRS